MHVLKPYKDNEFPYVPTAYDDQQTTAIVITADTTPQTITYKFRDKFTFKVGRGLTIKNLRFEALDSTAFYDVSADVWGVMPWVAASQCSPNTGAITKCANKNVAIARPP